MKQSHNIALILAGGTGERMHASVPKQFMEIDAKVIKKLGLKLKKYVKLDGTESTLYILTGKDEKATKHLHDLLTSGKLSKLCKYWGYVHGYKVPEKNLKEFVKLTGIKTA